MSANSRQFVDANILIYAHDRSAGEKHTQAVGLLKQLWQERAGCLSIQVLQEFYVNVTRKVAQPLTPEAAAQIIADLSVWEVHSPNASDVISAIQLQTRYGLSFWDAMILISAQQLDCATVWSEDLNAGQLFGSAAVRNPFG